MREDLPSVTACFVATARGMAGVDEVAADLLPPGFGAAARVRIRRLAPFVPLVDFMRVRTRAIDDAILAAEARGVRQLVTLGAGLCARAWRMPGLAATRVYEVDHPASQRYKQARL